MRLTSVARVALLTSLTRRLGSAGFIPPHRGGAVLARVPTTQRFMSSEIDLKHVRYAEMKALVDDYEELGRDGTNMVIIDVRNPEEIANTGKLSPNTITMPLPIIMQYGVFALDDEDFEELTGYAKPGLDETIVFSCAAGIRSVYAANYAAQQGGYSKLVNYVGGAYEWFAKTT